MIKSFGILILILFLLSEISASCNETQIEINTASAEELDKITGIGSAKAQAIIETRPFSSVDDLIRVNGIGNVTLSNIKTQGLACVVNEETQNTENNVSEDNSPEESETRNETYEEEAINDSRTLTLNPTANTITLDTINLNSKDIKSENNNGNLGKNLALGGIVTFCLLFGILFFLKFARRKTENEFR